MVTFDRACRPNLVAANFNFHLGKRMRRRSLNHTAVRKRKGSVVAWAEKEFALILNLVLNRAREVSAPPLEGDEFAVLFPNENTQITRSRIAESKRGTRFQIFD